VEKQIAKSGCQAFAVAAHIAEQGIILPFHPRRLHLAVLVPPLLVRAVVLRTEKQIGHWG
jgi:hypothetical protein